MAESSRRRWRASASLSMCSFMVCWVVLALGGVEGFDAGEGLGGVVVEGYGVLKVFRGHETAPPRA